MLVIRPEQMEVLRQYTRQRFISRMTGKLRAALHAKLEDTPDAELRDTIDAGIDSARARAITDEADVEGYLWYVARFGPEFGATAETRWAGEILEREDLSGSDKMERIEDTYLLEREA